MSSDVTEDTPLFAKASRALGWSFASTILGRLSTFAFGIALARILGPKEFGTFAVAMVALLALLSFNELGVSLAIVRWPGKPEEIVPTVATISVGASVLVYIGCYLGAPAFSAAMGDPSATGVVRLLALSVLISGLVATPVAMLQRNFRQDRKMAADMAAGWISSLTSIGCALAGLGAISLAYGLLAGNLAAALLFIKFEPAALRLGFDPAKARALLKFGLPLAGSSIVVFAVSNVDRIIVGAVFGPVSLGFYVLASNLANLPVSTFSQPVRAVAPAALARLQGNRNAMNTTFLSTAGLLAAVTLPICVVLVAAAGPLVRFVYGGAWEGAAVVLPWLGLLGALRILFELVYDYFVVLASTRVVFTVQVIWLAALVPALYYGSQAWGLAGAGIAQFAVALLVVLPIYLWELGRTGVMPGALGRRFLLPMLGAGVVAVAAVVADRLLPWDVVTLVVTGLISLGVIAALVYRMRGVLRTLRAVQATH